MRVVCVKSVKRRGSIPGIFRGCVYTLISKRRQRKDERTIRSIYPAGIYYELLECGSDNEYHSSSFIIIKDDQQDETEMNREYEASLATGKNKGE